MGMKLGFIGDNSIDDVISDAEFCETHGFEGLEYNYWGNFKELTVDTVKKMREILDAHGIAVSSLGLWGWNHISLDKSERETALEMLSRAIEFASILRAHVLVTGGGDIPGAPLEKKLEEFEKVFPPFLERIERNGMKLAMYALHGNSFFDSVDAYERLWEKFPQIGVKYDPANWMHHCSDYLAMARLHGDKIYHVHIKEHLFHNGELVSQPPAGMGDVHWGKLMAFLYEHNYDGYLSIEPHGPIWSRGLMRRKMLLLTKKYISQFLLL